MIAALFVLIIAAIALALLLQMIGAVAAGAAAFVAGHALLVAVIATVTVVSLGLLLRVFRRSAGKLSMVRRPAPALPPPEKPALPEPVGYGAVARPFTQAEEPPEPEPEPVPVQAVITPSCEGPGCTSVLHKDQARRWRIGTGTTPQVRKGPWPEDVVNIHEFCSDQCMRKYQAANRVSPLLRG